MSKIKLESDIHNTVKELESDRQTTHQVNEDRLRDIEIMYKFYNMRKQYTKEEKDKLGAEEVINFGSSFEAGQNFITPIESMVTGTKSLIKFKLDTDNPTIDIPLSNDISAILSDSIINKESSFTNSWTVLAGFCFIKSGGFTVWDNKDTGLFPRLADGMLFPAGTELQPDKIRGCYEEVFMDISGLEVLLKESKNDKQKKSIQQLIDLIKSDIKGEGSKHKIDDVILPDSRYDEKSSRESVSLWKYYEVRTRKDGSKYVSSILFARYNIKEAKDQVTILHQEKDIGAPSDWMVMIFSDLEIGGDTIVDTMRGIGEAHFEPSMSLEVLKNNQLDGAMIASKPVIKPNGADVEDLYSFNWGTDHILPEGSENIDVLAIPDTSRILDGTINQLSNSISGISRSEKSNTGYGQELLRQAGERVENTRNIKSNRLYRIYKPLDKMLNIMVDRALGLKLTSDDSHSEDYELIKYIQYKVDLAIIKHYKLAGEVFNPEDVTDEHIKLASAKRQSLIKDKFGRKLFYTVEANRQITGIDRIEEKETAKFISDLVQTGSIRHQQAQPMMKLAFILATGNEDLAELAYQDSPIVSTNQNYIAQAEWDVIIRRATTGEQVEINDTDDDIIHVENHMKDAIAYINSHNLDRWGQLDVMKFSMAMDHTGNHLQRMRSRPETANMVDEYYPTFQEIVKQSSVIIADIVQERDNQIDDEDPDAEKKRAETHKILLETQIMAENHGMKLEEMQRLAEQSKSRQDASERNVALNERRQYHKEILDQRKLQIEYRKNVRSGKDSK